MQEAEQIRITPQTAITGWSGEALDYDLAVDCLMQNDAREKRSRGNVF